MFRFTIRDVLWLTVVVALAVTWWLDRQSLGIAFDNRLRAVTLQQQRAEQELLVMKAIANEETQLQEFIRQRKEAHERPAWDASKAKSQELGAPQPMPLASGE
jgi:hypothetical protein